MHNKPYVNTTLQYKSLTWIAALIMLCSISLPTWANAESTLLKRITQAERGLSQTQTTIRKQKQALSKKLLQLENEVAALREKTAVARRARDESSLSITNLQQRLKTWRQQHSYQQNLLQQFQQQVLKQPLLVSSANGQLPALAAQLKQVNTFVDELQNKSHPQWRPQQVIGSNGEIKPLQTLSLGPVTWYIDPQQHHAGIASKHAANEPLKSDIVFASTAFETLSALKQAQQGAVIFDPTLTRALLREQQNTDVSDHLQKGGVWAIPILLFALVSLLIASTKAVQLWRLPRLRTLAEAHISDYLTHAEATPPKGTTSMQLAMLNIAKQCTHRDTRDDQLFIYLQQQNTRLEQYIGAIAVIASVSPLLGLLGTVSGMIETFHMMTLFGTGDPEVVSGGIAQALITTELGLVVAIPSLLLSALLSRKANQYYQQLEHFAITLVDGNPTDTQTSGVDTNPTTPLQATS